MQAHKILVLAAALTSLSLSTPVSAADDLVNLNLNFEQGLEGWSGIWSRDPGTATVAPDATVKHGGAQSVKIVHTGTKDWSFMRKSYIPVVPGDKYQWKGWVKVESVTGEVSLNGFGADANKKQKVPVIGSASLKAPGDWQEVVSEIVVPEGVAFITPRLTGQGPAVIWIDDFTLTKK